MEFNEENISRFIVEHGTAFIQELPDCGGILNQLLKRCIKKSLLESAQLLLNRAREHEVPVSLEWEETDALEWAIGQSLDDCIFVLGILLEKRTTAEEAARIIARNLRRLYQKRPKLVEQYFIENNFSMEIGRFILPKGVFDQADDDPFVILTDDVPQWDAADNHESKKFWIDNNKKLVKKIEKAVGGHDVAVWKFVCIEHFPDVMFQSNWRWQDEEKLPSPVSKMKNIRVFSSESIRSVTQWWWSNIKAGETLLALLLTILCAACLAFFVLTFTPSQLQWTEVFIDCALLCSTAGVFLFPKTAVPLSALIISTGFPESRTTFVVLFLTAECLLMILILSYLRLIKGIGPLISMIGHVIQDASSFVLILFIFLIGFTMAITVSIQSGQMIDLPGTTSHDPLTLAETLFYAVIGQFDPEDFHTDDALQTWISHLLLVVLLLVGHIVLMALLISIIGDTYDRMRRLFCHTSKWKNFKNRSLGCLAMYLFVFCAHAGLELVLNYGIDITYLIIPCVITAGTALNACIITFVESSNRLESLQLAHKKYFHILLPSEQTKAQEKPEWEGKVRQIEKIIEEKLTESETCTQRQLNEMKSEFTNFKSEIKSEITEMKSALFAITEKIDEAMR